MQLHETCCAAGIAAQTPRRPDGAQPITKLLEIRITNAITLCVVVITADCAQPYTPRARQQLGTAGKLPPSGGNFPAAAIWTSRLERRYHRHSGRRRLRRRRRCSPAKCLERLEICRLRGKFPAAERTTDFRNAKPAAPCAGACGAGANASAAAQPANAAAAITDSSTSQHITTTAPTAASA